MILEDRLVAALRCGAAGLSLNDTCRDPWRLGREEALMGAEAGNSLSGLCLFVFETFFVVPMSSSFSLWFCCSASSSRRPLILSTSSASCFWPSCTDSTVRSIWLITSWGISISMECLRRRTRSTGLCSLVRDRWLPFRCTSMTWRKVPDYLEVGDYLGRRVWSRMM